jgi:predicted enzyme related to lactoylglutathione lyase
MEKITGIGGVFFKVKDPSRMAEWYRQALGIETKDGYTDFEWREKTNPERAGKTVWSLFPADTEYFSPGQASFMVNYRVADLDALVRQLRSQGIEPEPIQDFEYGRFTWIVDPEGNRIELWQPLGEK